MIKFWPLIAIARGSAYYVPPVIVGNFCGTKTETNLQSIYLRLLWPSFRLLWDPDLQVS